MNNSYIQVTITNISSDLSDIVVAQLSEIGFDGFEEDGNTLKAFTAEDVFSADELHIVLAPLNLAYSAETIAAKNWNHEWESHFEPVIVDDFTAIRADFHTPIQNVGHEIIITPKMSFGTGHHATTYLMVQQMRNMEFTGKTVFDFGTGTGILAILAEKLGAETVTAIDNDEWSIRNAGENLQRNNCTRIKLSLENAPPGAENFDIILANINKNVILAYFPVLVDCLNQGGQLVFSGLLEEDEMKIAEAAKHLIINYISTTKRDKWICISFSKHI